MSCNGTLLSECFVTLIAVEDTSLLLLLIGLLDGSLGHVQVGLETDQLGSDHFLKVFFRHFLCQSLRLEDERVGRGPVLRLRHDERRRGDAGNARSRQLFRVLDSRR